MDEKLNQILTTLVEMSARQDQMYQILTGIDSRLARLEIKMGQVEKWISLENADFKVHQSKA